jgi:hypothetical protein
VYTQPRKLPVATLKREETVINGQQLCKIELFFRSGDWARL